MRGFIGEKFCFYCRTARGIAHKLQCQSLIIGPGLRDHLRQADGMKQARRHSCRKRPDPLCAIMSIWQAGAFSSVSADRDLAGPGSAQTSSKEAAMSANYPALSGLPVAIRTDRPANTRLAVERSRAVATCGVRRCGPDHHRNAPTRIYGWAGPHPFNLPWQKQNLRRNVKKHLSTFW